MIKRYIFNSVKYVYNLGTDVYYDETKKHILIVRNRTEKVSDLNIDESNILDLSQENIPNDKNRCSEEYVIIGRITIDNFKKIYLDLKHKKVL